MPIPLLIVGDGPQEQTGLGRIARDLAGLIATSDLEVDLVQVGGSVPPVWKAWTHYPLDRADDWGVSCVEAIWDSIWGKTPGVLWVIWDPGRLAAYMGTRLPTQKWAYTAIDSTNYRGSVGGPAGEALVRFDRVLAYGRWASTVVRTLRSPVPYLPHGLVLERYAKPAEAHEVSWVQEVLGPFRGSKRLVGCVATNQPRKDLALYCETLRVLLDRGCAVYGWLHTDVLVKSWAIQQLVEDFGLQKQITVTLERDHLNDRQLALLYQACAVTVAPGLGEGFGYPIVESLAAGVPVVHGDFGGGRELVPKIEWRFPTRVLRYASVYALKRPVFQATDAANAIERIWDWKEQIGADTASAYCRGAVAHLDWQALWPRWRGWIRKGLQ